MLGHGRSRKAVLISYMALAEDEEMGRSEKDSSLGENNSNRRDAVTHACRRQHCLFTVRCVRLPSYVSCTGVPCGHMYSIIPAQACVHLALLGDQLRITLGDSHGQLPVSSLLLHYGSALDLLLALQGQLDFQLCLQTHTKQNTPHFLM